MNEHCYILSNLNNRQAGRTLLFCEMGPRVQHRNAYRRPSMTINKLLNGPTKSQTRINKTLTFLELIYLRLNLESHPNNQVFYG